VSNIQLWDSVSGQVSALGVELQAPRSRHTASLLADGGVLVWGGVDAQGQPLTTGEVIDTKIPAVRFEASPIQPFRDPRSPLLADSLPTNDASGMPLGTLIGLRFSKPLNVATLNNSTVVLSSPEGGVTAKVVPTEEGMLVFVTPQAPLRSGAAYRVSVSGATDDSGQALPGVSILFTTEGGSTTTPSDQKDETAASSDPMDSSWRKLPPLQASSGETALAGQALELDGTPLPGVSIEIGSQKTSTDATGRFLLRNLAPGHHVMIIDGTPASRQGRLYGIYRVGVDIQGGRTNVLSYTIWMTPLDTRHVVRIPSPTTRDLVIVNPDVPGLELHIPANTVIRDARGRVVTEIGITPIPINQPPFPLKRGIVFPVYFTIQPGGATFSTAGRTWSASTAGQTRGARIHYQNYRNAKAGARFDFWNYDPERKGWYVYGRGRVSRDRRMIEPEPGVQIWTFDGAMVSMPGNAPPEGPKPDNSNPKDGEPVDLQTGLFVYSKTDLALTDVIPVALTRMYRQNDSISRAFGIGTNMPYDMFMVGDNAGGGFAEGYTYQDLILADGGRVHFTRTSPCDSSGYCGFTDAVYRASSAPGEFYGATLRWASGTTPYSVWLLTKKDGTVYEFGDSDGATYARYAAVLAIRDRYGNALTLTRDSNYNLTKITSPNGRWIQLSYDTSNRVTQAQDNSGRTVAYTYDAEGRLKTVTDAKSGVTTYGYDPNHNMVSIKDARNIVYLTNEYDADGRVRKQTQADSGTYEFDYTLGADGSVTATTVTDPRGNARKVTFNADGYMATDTRALGKPEQQTIIYTRQPGSGLIPRMTDSLNRQTTYTYDAMGNTTSVTRLAGTPEAVTTHFAYEPAFNNLKSVTDPLGRTTTLEYDSKGNVVAATDPLGNTTRSTYNTAGQPLTVTDPLGNVTQFTYQAGDLVGVTDPLNRTVSRFVDSVGRLGSVTDPLSRTVSYTYDALDQMTKVKDPLNNETLSTYDPNGNLLTVTDANQHATTYTYNNMDRVETRTDALSNSESYQYDLKGNLTQFTDRKEQVTAYGYDALDRRVFAGFMMGPGPMYESTINYTYDAGSRPAEIVDSASGTITRGYDMLDRLTSETTPQGTVNYTYDRVGRRETMTVSGQAATSYAYDAGDRLTQITQGTSTVSFAYDEAGRRTSLTLPNGIVVNYTYDAGSQLKAISYQKDGAALGDLGYGYDLAGRRVGLSGSFARTGLPDEVSTAVYNANNQLTQWGSATLTYDANGNTQAAGANSYTWNARNQLAAASGASFTYDAVGRRLGKTASGIATNYIYDGANPVQELAGSTPVANLLTGELDEYFLRTETTGSASFLTDALGGTVALADETGALTTHYTYEPFGKTAVTGAGTTNSFAFTGRELDATGLYYHRARYYSPTMGRFISEDPIGLAAGDGNLYAYVGNDPNDFADPFGLDKNKRRDSDCVNGLKRLVLSDVGKYIDTPARGTGTCVDFLKDTMGNYPTATWTKGPVPSSNTPLGTFVATFYDNNGTKYRSQSGFGHVGAWYGTSDNGIVLIDQYRNRELIGESPIRYGGKKNYNNNASNYYIVLVPCSK